VRTGRTRTTAKPTKAPADEAVCAISEAGGAGIPVVGGRRAVYPAGHSAGGRLSAALAATLKAPEVANALTRQGAIIIVGKPEGFPVCLKEESANWARVLEARRIKAQP
jgi:tripartite-type tricarboxylate transporter receptor subunit TctC